MVKLLGAACVLGAAVWAWRRGAKERRRELDTLADLIVLLDRMEGEIRLRRTSLPRLLASLGLDRGPEVRRFCAAVAASLERAAPLGELLQGDEESICKGISLTSHRLAKSLEEARDSRAEREKRAGALWLSGAALLVILLI